MEFLESLTDDQKAIAGCVVALMFSAMLLTLGNWIGSKVRSEDSPATIKLPENYKAQSDEDRSLDRAA